MDERALRVEEEKQNIKKQMMEDLEWREHLNRNKAAKVRLLQAANDTE